VQEAQAVPVAEEALAERVQKRDLTPRVATVGPAAKVASAVPVAMAQRVQMLVRRSKVLRVARVEQAAPRATAETEARAESQERAAARQLAEQTATAAIAVGVESVATALAVVLVSLEPMRSAALEAVPPPVVRRLARTVALVAMEAQVVTRVRPVARAVPVATRALGAVAAQAATLVRGPAAVMVEMAWTMPRVSSIAPERAAVTEAMPVL
jgi:hypothetical protein